MNEELLITLKQQKEDLEQQNKYLEEEVNIQNDTIKALTQENDKLKNGLNETTKTLTNGKDNLQKELNIRNEAIRSITNERDTLKKELNKQNETIKALTIEKNNLKQESSKQSEQLTNQLKAKQQELKVIEQRYNELKQDYHDLERLTLLIQEKKKLNGKFIKEMDNSFKHGLLNRKVWDPKIEELNEEFARIGKEIQEIEDEADIRGSLMFK